MDKKSTIKKKVTTKCETALEKYVAENKDIAEALEVLKETQDVRNLRPLTLDRFSYQSVE